MNKILFISSSQTLYIIITFLGVIFREWNALSKFTPRKNDTMGSFLLSFKNEDDDLNIENIV